MRLISVTAVVKHFLWHSTFNRTDHFEANYNEEAANVVHEQIFSGYHNHQELHRESQVHTPLIIIPVTDNDGPGACTVLAYMITVIVHHESNVIWNVHAIIMQKLLCTQAIEFNFFLKDCATLPFLMFIVYLFPFFWITFCNVSVVKYIYIHFN